MVWLAALSTNSTVWPALRPARREMPIAPVTSDAAGEVPQVILVTTAATERTVPAMAGAVAADAAVTEKPDLLVVDAATAP